MQLGQPPALAVGQRPGGRVGAQQLHGRGAAVGDGHPALDHVAAHPVVQRDGHAVVVEPQPQCAVLHVVRHEAPLGAAPPVGAYGQGGADEAGAALDGVLLPAVERRLEGPGAGQRARRQRLGVGERDRWPPVQVEQFVRVGETQGVAAAGARQQPGTTVFGDVHHRDLTGANSSAQASTSSRDSGPVTMPVDNSLPEEIDAVWSTSVPAGEPRRRGTTGRSPRDAAGPVDRAGAGRCAQFP